MTYIPKLSLKKFDSFLILKSDIRDNDVFYIKGIPYRKAVTCTYAGKYDSSIVYQSIKICLKNEFTGKYVDVFLWNYNTWYYEYFSIKPSIHFYNDTNNISCEIKSSIFSQLVPKGI